MKPISIIIPTHNNENTIVDTIVSVQKQTSRSWNCILVDDHSSDRTTANIKSKIVNDERFQLVENSVNRGANFCRNIGLKLCKDDLLLFLDGDDILYPDCIETRSSFLKGRTDLDMLVSQTTYFKHDINNVIEVFRNSESDNNKEKLIVSFLKHQIIWTTTAVTWNKNFLVRIQGWNEDYPRLQDVELNIRALMESPVIAFTGRADSYLRKSEFTQAKRVAAFWGFTNLISSFYGKLMASTDDEKTLNDYGEAFQHLIQMIVRYYFLDENNYDEEMKAYFLKTVQMILDESSYEQIFEALSLLSAD